MSLSVPNNPLSVNPGVSTPAVSPVPVLQSRTLINQVRGTTASGSTGSGIPKAVTNVQASLSNASKGATSTINIQFRRDPTDKAYARVLILAQGYQGNNTPVQVGSSADSPATIILNNTGEAITLIVQASGNGGAVPLSQCPSVGAQLPKSAGGGVGTTTVTQVVTSGALTGDVTTAGSVATVVGIQGKSVSSNAPLGGDFLWFDPATGGWEPNWFPHIKSWSYNLGAGTFSWVNQPTGQLTSGGTDTAPTATEPASYKASTSATASTAAFGISSNVDGVVLGLCKRWQCRARANSSANARYWIGFTSKTSPITVTTLASDFPTSVSMCAFRFSAGTDTNWQAICCDGSTQTIVNTGVAPDHTNSQLFDIYFDGTNVYFFINRTQVAKISTHLPVTSTVLTSANTVDNKNTANAVTIQLYDCFYQEK